MQNLSAQMQQLMNRRGRGAEFNRMMSLVLKDTDVQAFLKANEAELDAHAVERSASHLYEFCMQNAKAKRGEPTIAPGYAPRLRLNDHLIDVEYVPNQQMIAESKAREQRELVTAVSMPRDIKDATLAGYEQTPERMNAIVAAADFAEGLVKAPKQFHQGLYLYGPFGVGKTYLLGAVANNLAEHGIASTLLHLPTFAVQMKAAISQGAVLPKIEQVQDAPVLMLDDIGAESFSPWFRDEVLGVILQHRMEEELPTCFSSNKSMADLTDFLAGRDTGSDEATKAERIMQRVKFLSREIVLNGVNRRENKVNH
ncbi:primosomal protein DnaI [Lacticaseibacillus pabuli]|uniref:Primosomal protein DnaI n=1 Tax=Lacticaseibacillus pabuli TaxID=3025672 RepID=A0ABY7WUS7_9LACO|nr:primosomal protein DnaI [Lacticaseibacillus sp. KACC 23028]WDF83539.1 primosomal protein DnaI [Lacticaseibacillus sp. KACC 23028]